LKTNNIANEFKQDCKRSFCTFLILMKSNYNIYIMHGTFQSQYQW